MLEHVEMSVDVAIEIHRHEAGKLQETRIDLAPETRIGQRHGVQAVLAEPVDAARLGELVDLGRAPPRVDRAAHERHAGGRIRIRVRFHHGGGDDQRHRGLTDPERMHARTEVVQNLDQVVDVVVQAEIAVDDRDDPRVRPVGDVDVAMGQEGRDRAAQERRVMARHRRDDQELRLLGPAGEIRPGKTQQAAEGPGPDDLLLNRIRASVLGGEFIEAEGRLAVAAGHALEHLRACRNVLAEKGMGQRVPGIAEGEMGGVRPGASGHKRRMRHLIEFVRFALEHAQSPPFPHPGAGGRPEAC